MSKSAKSNKFAILGFVIISLFLFLRLFQLPQSMLFFGDMGRDFLELYEWQQTKIPPLLGPQTSALPFNQSAWYFYLLMPFYLITGQSLFSSVIAVVVIHTTVFLLSFYSLRNQPKLLKLMLTAFYLISIHPQFIIQHRYVWNPSFVGLFILIAFFSLIRLQKKLSNITLAVFSLSLSAAVSFSYSTAPAIFAFLLVAFYLLKPRLKIILSFFTGLFILNFPTLVFELRHSFLLTQMMLLREKLPQTETGLTSKLQRLSQFILMPNPPLSTISLILFAIGMGILIYKWRHNNLPLTAKVALVLFVLTTTLTMMAPFSIHTHYIFGILITAMLVIATLPRLIKLAIITVLSLQFLTPAWINSYTRPARRTVSQTQACAQHFCDAQTDPIFVSVQASFHPYHDARDFRYLFLQAGCQVPDLITQPQAAKHMAVVSDDSVYTHGQTAYNELTLFGRSDEKTVFICQDNLKIHVLEQR